MTVLSFLIISVELVNLLLQHSASTEVRNKANKTPIDCALNTKIDTLLSTTTSPSTEVTATTESVSVTTAPKSMFRACSDVELVSESRGLMAADSESPELSRRKRDFASLMKAIANGDEDLVRQKLGLLPEDDVVKSSDQQSLCHPLCACSKCAALQNVCCTSTAFRFCIVS